MTKVVWSSHDFCSVSYDFYYCNCLSWQLLFNDVCVLICVLLFRAMEEADPEEQFLKDARNGNLQGIQRLLMSKIKEEAKIDINCKGLALFLISQKYCQFF